jgi:hypothetical protein
MSKSTPATMPADVHDHPIAGVLPVPEYVGGVLGCVVVTGAGWMYIGAGAVVMAAGRLVAAATSSRMS